MYEFPEDLWYTPEGLWVRIEGNIATVGISDWLQDKVGGLLQIDYNEYRDAIIEVQDVGGKVIKFAKPAIGVPFPDNRNDEALMAAFNINNDPYGNWLFKLKMPDPKARTGLLTAAQFRAKVGA